MKRDFSKALLLSGLVLSAPLPAWAQATKTTTNPAAGATNAQPKAPQAERSFQFGGGDFNQFITRLREFFGKEVLELVETRGESDRFRVPKMRIPGATDIREVFLTYNQLSREGDGFLGKWIFSPQISVSVLAPAGYQPVPGVPFSRQPVKYDTELNTIVFLPPKASGVEGAGGIEVRAFSVRGLSEERLKAFEEIINNESARLQREIVERAGDIFSAAGRLNVHAGTHLLVASGGKMYVELVSAVMEAFPTAAEKANMMQVPAVPRGKFAEPH
jgi:hypothetical protein